MMVKFSPMGIVACLLCVGILFVGFSSPQHSRLDADDIAQKKAEVDRADTLVKQLAQSLHDQSTINRSLTEADNRTIEVIEKLQASIMRLGEHVKESVPTREEVVRLVSTEAEATRQDGECTCGEKLADLQKQIDELKAKVASLECAPAKTSAAATSSYGTVSSGSVVVSSGGSTGSVVKSGGSTGSSVSYGSTGSKVYSQSTSRRWQNHDGLSTNDHAALYHGLNTQGMTQSQINAQLDSDHDRFGPMHDAILASRTRTVTRSTASYPVQSTSNCPGGVCPTSSVRTVNRGGGLLGFGIIGRR